MLRMLHRRMFLDGLADGDALGAPAFDRRASGVALESRLGQAYTEDAFRYFLDIERKRAARAGRPILILLITLKRPQAAIDPRIDSAVATGAFGRLWRSLRETDVVGWYRTDRVIGAVLNQLEDGPHQNVSALIRQRVSGAIAEGLPADAAPRLRVRVYQLRPALKE